MPTDKETYSRPMLNKNHDQFNGYGDKIYSDNRTKKIADSLKRQDLKV